VAKIEVHLSEEEKRLLYYTFRENNMETKSRKQGFIKCFKKILLLK